MVRRFLLTISLCIVLGAVCSANETSPVIPLNAQKQYALGVAEMGKNDFRGAIGYFTQAIAIYNQYIDAFDERGAAFAALGKYDAATDDYEQAIALSQPVVPAELYHKLGLVYGMSGALPAALADMDLAIKIDPNQAVYYYDRGITEKMSGDTKHALPDINKALEISPGYTEALYARAIIYGEQANYDKALTDFNEVIHRLPEDYRHITGAGKYTS